MRDAEILLFFCIVSGIGMGTSYLLLRTSKEFRWSSFVAFLFAPVCASLLLTLVYGWRVLFLFAVSCVVGFLMEFSLGLLYHKTLKHRLWSYDRYNVGGYTSWLTIPMWGVAGVLFWLLGRVVGL